MSKHTPGPWKWHWKRDENAHNDCGVYAEPKDGHAYSVCRAPKYESRKQWESNARLIAAAPDLLAALLGLMNGSIAGSDGRWDQISMPSRSAMNAASAAIAKATGEGHG